MGPFCPEIYSSPCLDLIFSALSEIQPKLSRNAGIYLNSARNPGQFWSTWGYLSLGTCPVLAAQPMREVSVVPPTPRPRVPRDARAGCSQGCALGQPRAAASLTVPSWWGWWEEQSRAGPSTHPLRAPQHRKTAALHLHTTCTTANKEMA